MPWRAVQQVRDRLPHLRAQRLQAVLAGRKVASYQRALAMTASEAGQRLESLSFEEKREAEDPGPPGRTRASG